MQWIQQDWQHEYLATPWEYPIGANENHSTYDQFIQLRDTLIFSWKYYNWKKGLKLAVWESEETIEVQSRQYWRQSFEPGYESDTTKITTMAIWDYVSIWHGVEHEGLLCTINKTWRYRLSHKQQFYQLTWDISKIHCYVQHNHIKEDGSVQVIPRAVFDWEWSFEKEFEGTCSTSEWSGTCKVTVKFTLWDILQKITSFGYIDADLEKWDWLRFMAEDQTLLQIDSTKYMQPYSNWWCVEYLDLPYNNL